MVWPMLLSYELLYGMAYVAMNELQYGKAYTAML